MHAGLLIDNCVVALCHDAYALYLKGGCMYTYTRICMCECKMFCFVIIWDLPIILFDYAAVLKILICYLLM